MKAVSGGSEPSQLAKGRGGSGNYEERGRGLCNGSLMFQEDLGREGRRMKRQEIETKHGDKAPNDRNPQIMRSFSFLKKGGGVGVGGYMTLLDL